MPGTICQTEFWTMPFVAQMTAMTGYDITITSGCDGKHKSTSMHYSGNAVDIRTRDAEFDLIRWVKQIQSKLGSRYYACLEPDHIHIQFNG
jgi:hypothetical protein